MAETAEVVPTPAKVPPSTRVTGETVTVACKLPSGLILRTFTMEEYQVPHPNGSFAVARRAVRNGPEYKLNGFAVDLGKLTAGNLPEHLIIGGYGLTPGVPRDFWEKWLEDNRDSALVKNHLIFAQPNEASARDAARERAGLRSGLEPMDPEKLPNDVRRVQKATRDNNDADNL